MHVCKSGIVALDLTVFLIWTAIFWLIILAINSRMDLSRFNIIIYPLLLIVRSERIVDRIGKLNERVKKALMYMGDISILISTSMMIVFPVVLVMNEFFFSNEVIAVGAIRVYNLDTVLVILFSLAFALFVHEGSHAMASIANKADIKSLGMMIFGFIPNFFVETGDNFDELPRVKKLRIIASGPSANIILVLVMVPFLLFLPIILSPMYTSSGGALVIDVQKGSPAEEAGITTGDVITQVFLVDSFGNVVQEVVVTKPGELRNLIGSLPADNLIELNVSGRIVSLETTASSGGSSIGVTVDYNFEPRLSFLPRILPYFLGILLSWMINFNLTLGFLNLMVFPRSDGDKILKELASDSKIAPIVVGVFRFVVTPVVALLILKSVFT